MGEFQRLAEECLRLPAVAALAPQPLADGSGWCVEVTWSDGRIEQIATFDSESSARDWIEWEAPRYFRERSAGAPDPEPREQS